MEENMAYISRDKAIWLYINVGNMIVNLNKC